MTGTFLNLLNFESLFNYSFDWIIELHKKRVDRESFIPYLLDRIYKDTKNFTFYFGVHQLALDKVNDIRIGRTSISFLLEDKRNEMYECLDKEDSKIRKNAIDGYEQILQSVVAISSFRGIKSKCLDMAKNEADLAVAALKCFCTDYACSRYIAPVNLDFNATRADFAKHIMLENNNIKNGIINLENRGSAPVIISGNFLTWMNRNHFQDMHNFLLIKRDTELVFIIQNLIRSLGDIVSTFDDYLKSVKIISFFEGFCIPQNSPTAKGEKIIKQKILPILTNSDQERIKIFAYIRRRYEIRDKFLHNSIKLPIRRSEMIVLMRLQRLFILTLIGYSEDYTTRAEVLIKWEVIY